MSTITFTPRAWAAAGAVAAAAAVSPAQATLLSTTNPIITPNGSTSSFANPEGFPDGTQNSVTLQVAQFDSSLGMLQAVELDFDATDLSSELNAFANLSECQYEGVGEPGSCSYAYSVSFDVSGTVTSPDGTVSQTADGTGSSSKVVSDADMAAGTQSFFADIINDIFLTTPLVLGSSPFPDYVGNSTWPLVFGVAISNVSVSSICTASGQSNCMFTTDQGGTLSGQANWNANNVQVTYHYMTTAPVPEPGSLLLMGAGLGAACLARRRRKRPQTGH